MFIMRRIAVFLVLIVLSTRGLYAENIYVSTASEIATAMNTAQPGDTLILQYKACEEAINFGIGAFFTYGIRELFNNN